MADTPSAQTTPQTAPARDPERFDLIVIGSGSGNSLITDHWRGRRVAIVEAGVFGGTCLNRGCIPTKMYAYPAQLAALGPEAARVDVGLEFTGADFTALRDRVFGRVDAISDAGLRYRRDELEHTEVVAEEVRFTGERELTTASGRVLTADRIVVAAGSRPRVPDVPGVDHPAVHTSDTVMRLDRLPDRMVVLGGGFIAAEFASVFSALGTEVVQVNRGPRLLAHHDDAVSERFTAAAARQWDLRTGWALAAVEPVQGAADGDQGRVRVRLDQVPGQEPTGPVEAEVEADVVLLALGRVPNTDRLDAAAAGLDVTARGTLAVDEHQRLLRGGQPVEGMYALGDVANEWQLKHVANHEARVVAHNLEHPEDLRRRTTAPVPAAVFARPQVASVGMTQAQAEAELGADAVTVKEQAFGDVAYGWAMEDREGLCKVVAERATGRILGAHLIGHEAAALIQPLVQAMTFGVDAHTAARGQYWPHPALTEVVENALLGLDVPDSGLL